MAHPDKDVSEAVEDVDRLGLQQLLLEPVAWHFDLRQLQVPHTQAHAVQPRDDLLEVLDVADGRRRWDQVSLLVDIVVIVVVFVRQSFPELDRLFTLAKYLRK